MDDNILPRSLQRWAYSNFSWNYAFLLILVVILTLRIETSNWIKLSEVKVIQYLMLVTTGEKSTFEIAMHTAVSVTFISALMKVHWMLPKLQYAFHLKKLLVLQALIFISLSEVKFKWRETKWKTCFIEIILVEIHF